MSMVVVGGVGREQAPTVTVTRHKAMGELRARQDRNEKRIAHQLATIDTPGFLGDRVAERSMNTSARAVGFATDRVAQFANGRRRRKVSLSSLRRPQMMPEVAELVNWITRVHCSSTVHAAGLCNDWKIDQGTPVFYAFADEGELRRAYQPRRQDRGTAVVWIDSFMLTVRRRRIVA